jgi:hypothetical protein
MILPGPAHANSWERIRPSVIVFVVIVSSVAAFTVSARYIGRHYERFMKLSQPPTAEEAVSAVSIEHALTSAEYNDVIFLGDSAPLFAIDTVYFDGLTGLTAYNLAAIRSVGVNGFLLTAQAYLSKHPAPRIIVLCVSPEVPGGTDVDRLLAIRFVRVYGRQVGAANSAVDSIVKSVVDADGDAVIIKRGMSVVRDYAALFGRFGRYDFRDDPIEGLPEGTFNSLERQRRENRGSGNLGSLHGPHRAPLYAGVRFSTRPEWDRAVRALIDLANVGGVRLMVRLAPARADAASENFEEISGGLRDLQREFPQVIVDPEVHFYDSALCYDVWHLNAVGMKKFTQLLARDVRSAIDGRTQKAQPFPKAGKRNGKRKGDKSDSWRTTGLPRRPRG